MTEINRINQTSVTSSSGNTGFKGSELPEVAEEVTKKIENLNHGPAAALGRSQVFCGLKAKDAELAGIDPKLIERVKKDTRDFQQIYKDEFQT